MLIAQISDTHVQMPGGELDRNYDTAGHLEHAVRHLNSLEPQPDLVLLTGDTVDEGTADEYGRLRDILAELKPPLYVIPGNHDNREEMRRAFISDGYLPRDGFLQYTIEDWPVRLIGLDTHIPGQHGGTLCSARLDWLAARLSESPERPTVVFLHHPPFAVGHLLMDEMGLDSADGLASVLAPHDQVRHVLSGHLHRSVVTQFAGTVASVCPSTAQQLALDLPPARRLATVMDPAAATLLLWDENAATLVHHLSYITARPIHVLHDGTGWLEGQSLPAGFHN
ncbi:MAG: Icc protein [Gammaproteobacteria bacterium]|jgi:Icc protein